MILGLLSATALASSPAALGVPNHGGSFSAPTRAGVYSLTYSPTGALSETGEVLLDTSVLHSRFSIQLEGQEANARTGLSPLASLAASYPLLDRVGIGVQTGLPYARIGTGEPDGPFRMWTVDGVYALYENRLSVAVKPHARWTIGAGLRHGYSIFDSFIAMDTGALMYQLYGSPADELIGDPLLEGTRHIKGGGGHGFGYTLGARFEPIDDVVFVVSYVSFLSTQIQAEMEMVPSNDLALIIKGDIAGVWTFPEEFNVGLSLPVGPATLHANAEYIGWGSVSTTLANVNDAYVDSDDPFLTGVLRAYGLTDPAALGNYDTTSYTGMQNILTGGVTLTWDPHPSVTTLAAVHYTPAAIPDTYVSPGNIDFEGIDYRIGALWRPNDSWELGASVDVWAMNERNVTTSIADVYNEAPLPNTPSGNGIYSLGLQRLGLSTLYRF